MESVHGAESWRIQSDRVTAWVSREGGMVTATFLLGEREVSPYSLSPWQPGDHDASVPALLRVLRGDFFCLPFGPQADGLPHGEPANLNWDEIDHGTGTLVVGMDAGDSHARIEKKISLRDGQTAIYYDFSISGLEGEWSYGNHPVLDCSGLAEGMGRVSVSPFRWASVYPGYFSDPDNGEVQSLLPSARFDSLDSVPRIDQGTADLTRWPVRKGSEDLVMMVNEPATEEQPFAWSAVVFDGWVWFGLKDPGDFPATLFWMSNGGRPGAPWEGRHLGRLGIEEVCSHFCDGVAESRENSSEDIATVRRFRRNEVVNLRIVQGVAKVHVAFGKVVAIVPAGDDRVRITDEAGDFVEVVIDWRHVVVGAEG